MPAKPRATRVPERTEPSKLATLLPKMVGNPAFDQTTGEFTPLYEEMTFLDEQIRNLEHARQLFESHRQLISGPKREFARHMADLKARHEAAAAKLESEQLPKHTVNQQIDLLQQRVELEMREAAKEQAREDAAEWIESASLTDLYFFAEVFSWYRSAFVGTEAGLISAVVDLLPTEVLVSKSASFTTGPQEAHNAA